MAKIACLVCSKFEDTEVTVPGEWLRAEGHVIEFVGIHGAQVLDGKWGMTHVTTDASVAGRRADGYDALLIPGGGSPARLRVVPEVVQFVREFAATGRPIAAIGHGPELLVEASVVNGVRMTAWPSVYGELKRAGARVVDAEVVEDQQFITSRQPQDLEAFTNALLHRLSRGASLVGALPTEPSRPFAR